MEVVLELAPDAVLLPDAEERTVEVDAARDEEPAAVVAGAVEEAAAVDAAALVEAALVEAAAEVEPAAEEESVPDADAEEEEPPFKQAVLAGEMVINRPRIEMKVLTAGLDGELSGSASVTLGIDNDETNGGA